MPETKIFWTEFATRELESIIHYLAEKSQSFEIAYNMVESIFQRTIQLIEMPLSGQVEQNLADYNVRYLIVGNYKIHYIYRDNNIYITDVFHTKRNPQNIQKD